MTGKKREPVYFFLNEKDFGKKLDGLKYHTSYKYNQASTINKEYSHNLYYYPNGEIIEKSGKVTIKSSIYRCIHVKWKGDYSDMVDICQKFSIPLPTSLVQMGDSYELYWNFEKELTLDLHHVQHVFQLFFGYQTPPKKKPQAAIVPGSIYYESGEKPTEAILFNKDGNTYSDQAPKTYLDDTRMSDIISLQKKIAADFRAKNSIFREITDVNVISLKPEDIAEQTPEMPLAYNNEYMASGFIKTKEGRELPHYGRPLEYITAISGRKKAESIVWMKEKLGIIMVDYDEVIDVSEYNGYEISNDSVGLTLINNNGNKPKEKLIFLGNIVFIGWGWKQKDEVMGYSGEKQKAYILMRDNKQIIIDIHTKVSTFNSKYKADNLAFLGNDNDLALFYQILFQKDFQEYKIIEESVCEEDMYIVGDTEVYLQKPDYIVTMTQKKNFINKELTQTTVQDFAVRISKLRKGKKAGVTMLASIALAGMNYRQSHKYRLAPFLLISGSTGTGKSELLRCLMAMCGYNKERYYSINEGTVQPIAAAATDGAILWLDEFTNFDSRRIENTIRNVINGERAVRGHLTGNVEYDYQSPVVLAGEYLPSSESVVNRAVYINIDVTDRYKSGEDLTQEEKKEIDFLLRDIQSKTCFYEIAEFYMNVNPDDLQEVYDEQRIKLLEKGLNSRQADARSFVYTMNVFFPLLTEEAIDSVCLESIRFVNPDDSGEGNAREIVENIIAQGSLSGSVRGHVDTSDEKKTLVTFYFSSFYFNKVMTELKKAVPGLFDLGYNAEVKRDKLQFTIHEQETGFSTEMSSSFLLDETEQQVMLSKALGLIGYKGKGL